MNGYIRDSTKRGTGRTRALLEQAIASPHKNTFFVVHSESMVRYAYFMIQDLLADTHIVGNRTKHTWTHPDGRVLHIVTSPAQGTWLRGYVDTHIVFDHQ